MFQNAHLSQSLLLAQQVENQFSTTVKRKSRGVKQAGFVVLRTTTMPSILVETGFLSNQEEAKYLNSEKGQVYLASAMYRAIKSYKKMLETGGLGFKNQFSARGQKQHSSTEGLKASSPKRNSSRPTIPADQNNSKQPTPFELTAPTVEQIYPSSSKPTITYSVQLASSPTSFDLNKKPWSSIQGLRCLKIGSSYKCLYGVFEHFSEAVDQQSRLRKEGFKGAFLIAFQQGKKIPLPARN
jgi:N-acetylmuramoyl-L-alanine amidase